MFFFLLSSVPLPARSLTIFQQRGEKKLSLDAAPTQYLAKQGPFTNYREGLRPVHRHNPITRAPPKGALPLENRVVPTTNATQSGVGTSGALELTLSRPPPPPPTFSIPPLSTPTPLRPPQRLQSTRPSASRIAPSCASL